ncbi:MAG TPA: hypothetical protein VGK73_26190, partial [Polyangiaceae bacterium]
MRTLRLWLVGILAAAACAGARPKSSATPPKPPGNGARSVASAKAPAASARPSPRPPASSSAAPRAATGPEACPNGMVLVEGEYCGEVEHQCKKSWYDKSNRKVVCEEFEPVSRCKGEKTKKRYCIDTY